MAGKYRPIGVAEKRAMLEEAGEEWPIGSDGLPKVWDKDTSQPIGGSWKLRSTVCAKMLAFKRRRNAAGFCWDCGNQLDCESNVHCWSCLDKKKEKIAFAY